MATMTEPIAIIGSACRFPGSATSPSKLWELLKAPKDILRDFPLERLNFSNFHNQDGEHHGSTDVRGQSYLLQEDCRLFDAAFFRINPKEAHSMDPQQRLLLETVFEALEAAGLPLDMIEGSPTGVYVGQMTSDYNDIIMRDPESLPTYTATGLARSILSNRISYFFDLKGPSMTIDTACSSSLVAMHQAVQYLRNGNTTQAIVAGTTLLLDPGMYIAESKLHMLSSEARSRMWDKNANGYARGEGCAAVLLKPLSKAIQDGDHIECIIRSTGINCDGRTNGITMPGASAQTDLIRETYKSAGLDVVADRCQYFECHGTGTIAGDPVEARAIQEAFFPTPSNDLKSDESPLYCGSVKTVIGHLEGCAGLAGVLKASLALQNKSIPPNMHFKELNPTVKPFYKNLYIPVSALPWPETHGKPLRASVNSFGFGGANAHAILERYEAPAGNSDDTFDPQKPLVGPFAFSAKSRSSLLRTLKEVANHVQENPSLNLDSLSWVLQSKRTAFSTRIAIAASHRQGLLDSLEKQIRTGEASADAPLGIRALGRDPEKPAKILGVFTGQGAQWPAMGRDLMTHSPLFRKSIENCESALSKLQDPPSWSLKQELVAEGTDSRLFEARFSQPLCTAIQIALVDHLHASGIQFDAVVGHSSGEIGAAYAAGVLSAREAIGIAYYRGVVAHLAKGASGEDGGMLAVGISFDAATSFCSQPLYDGNITVAASNASSSVTLSGDRETIKEAKDFFDQEKIFARLLKVDTAYHSHHMLRCSERYMAYLEHMGIQPQEPRKNCIWVSSVRGDVDMLRGPLGELKGQYWVDNMVKPVLFSQALEMTRKASSFALALEVGPHPALKGPVGQTLKMPTDSPMPYAGCLERGGQDVESMSRAIGFLWSHLGSSVLDFAGWRSAFPSNLRQRQMLKNLPSYPWDHDQVYWHESRLSHNYRLGAQTPHELLGRLQEDAASEMSWRNVLRLNEMPWLRGHMFQGQAVFPGAGYVSMAVQAAGLFVRGRQVKMIEIHDMNILKAMVIEEDSVGVETIFTVRTRGSLNTMDDDAIIAAEFVCHSCSDGRVLDKGCDGRLLIHLGSPQNCLPPSNISQAELPPLDVDRFFQAISGLGIVYDGVFRTLKTINRTWGHAKASASWTMGDLGEKYSLHPAILDVAFQTAFATFASIADKAIGCTYLPAGIRRIVIDPAQRFHGSSDDINIEIEAHLAKSSSSFLEVDMTVCNGISSGIQVDGLMLKAIAEPQPSEDRLLFAKTVWEVDAACNLPSPPPRKLEQAELEYIDTVERTALFFMQRLINTIRPEEIRKFKWHHQQLMGGYQTLLDPVYKGTHAVLKKDWLNDSREIIRSFAERYPDSVDLALLTAVGENIVSVVRGESEMLEHMLPGNLLGRLYMEGRGFSLCNDYVAAFMHKISHKFPRTKILEVGAGTGGTTRSVFDTIGDAYSSYTYTDISAGFFEKASEKFAGQAQKMEFKTFNAENRPAEQGFKENSYDIVIAANVLHATRDLTQTMRNTRALMRSGGFLIAVEVTGTMLREPGLMGGLEGWWLGANDGRVSSPGISARRWNDVLQQSGFSGVESIVYDMPDISRHNCSVFVTQAIDERFDLIRDPLALVDLIPEASVMIVGGQTLPVSKAVRRVEKLLKRWTSRVTTYNSIDDLDPSEIVPGTCVLCLAELDKAIFSESMTAKRLENLQELLGNAQSVLWVTSGRLADDPYSNMMVGIGRALSFELPHVQMQFLDFDEQSSWDMEMAVQYLLRMVLLSSPGYLDHDILWAQEPEVAVVGETTLVPRVVRDDEANEGLNSKRRRIIKLAGPSERIEVLHHEGPSSKLTLVTGGFPSIPDDLEYAEVEVKLSVALHSNHDSAASERFLCFGYLRDGKTPAFAVTKTDTSLVVVPRGNIFEPSTASDCNAETLVAMGSALITSYILSTSPKSGTILIHEPSNYVAEVITHAARLAEQQVIFITADTTRSLLSGWIAVHPLAQARTVRQLIPGNAIILWYFSNSPVDNIIECLPKDSVFKRFDPGFIPHHPISLSAAFETATSKAWKEKALSIVDITDVSQGLGATSHDALSTILNWKRTGLFNVTVRPLDASAMFSAERTYFMVGMGGELGQSLCRFMVNCGARYIVLSSRNPVVDEYWLAEMRVLGVDIRVVRMDVTDRAQVHETVSMIRKTMPAVAGVGNAALVLEDSLFLNTTVSSVQHQLQPKVNGSLYLDEEFSSDNLDFFIAFSSLGSVYGNAGQSIYHAANLFMTSLVEKRRKRGQAASVINIGMIVDVGYVAKSQRGGSGIEDHLRTQFYTPLAETEFHHLIVQAILSGHPGSANAEVTMGLQPFIDDPNAVTRPHWYNDPRFSHMIFPPVSSDSPSQSGSSAQQLREKLEKTESITEATGVYQEIFFKKIEAMMKIPAVCLDVDAPLSDLGLDSLLAVEIRSWLLKDLHLDVPLLKILGRVSMISICADAAKKFFERKATVDGNGLVTKEDAITVESAALNVARIHDSSIENSTSQLGNASPSASITFTNSEHNSPKSNQVLTSVASSVSNFPIEAEEKELVFVPEFMRVECTAFAQASLHFLHNFLDDPTTFNVTAQYDITGPLNVNRFARALEKTLARHEAYQTCFFTEPGSLQLKQGVASNVCIKDRFTHIQSTTAEEIDHAFQTLSKHEWNLAIGQTFQAMLITGSPETHTLIIGCNHIIMDGMSWHIFLQDLDRAYQMIPLKPVAMSYLDFAHHQIEALNSGQLTGSIDYWMSELDPIPGVLPLLPLALARNRKARQVYSNHSVQRELSVKAAQAIKDASQACRVTPMQFYLAVVQTLLACLLDLGEVCIGVTDSGRGADDILAETVGHFPNLLPMCFSMDREKSFIELLQNTSQTVLNGYAHAQVPIDIILERLGMHRSLVYTPLFQVVFNYRIGDLLQRKLGNCDMELDRYIDAKMPYDFSFNITQTAQGGHVIEVSSNDYLYSKAGTEFVLDAFFSLLEALSLNPSTKVQDCRPYTDVDVERSLNLGRGPRVDFAWPDTLTERFQQVQAAYPSLLAIKDSGNEVTYDQLATRTHAIAAALLDAGAGLESRVAVLCEPSIDTYAAMLAILHIGAMYVPLDMSLPSARHAMMVNECKPQLLLCHAATIVNAIAQNSGESTYGEIAILDLGRVPLSAEAPPTPAVVGDSFLLFTSGSTGTPKGIRVSQSGVMNYAASKSARLGLGVGVRVLQQSSTGFDMSIAQAFNAFANAGTLVVASSKARGDPVMIAQLMLEESIELTIGTPSEYLMLATYATDTLRQAKSWKHACSGGELVVEKLLSELRRLELPYLILTDCYGPTEISCAATFKTTPLHVGSEWYDSGPVSVGKAIPNVSLYIVGKNNEVLPVGFPGEICVGGRGVARGYLDDQLNVSKFVTNTYATSGDIARGWKNMYRTGDKGCLREDGSLVFLGRTDGDTLVKLRGLRIELNEVANLLLHASQGILADAVITVRGQPEFLVAHVLFTKGQQLSQAELNTLCADLPLPRYMVPSIIVPLKHLPITPNGKVDRKALAVVPLPVRINEDGEGVFKALSVAEGELRLIWREVLGEISDAATIQGKTDFFTVGGSSLLLVQLQNLLKERMGVDVQLQDLYQASTLSRMATITSKQRSQLVAERTDWAAETAVPASILNAAHATTSGPAPREHQRQVVLTGATGFLGSEILRQLVDNDDVAKIHCIAVPADSRHKVLSSAKIVVYPGSLLSPTLGLSGTEVAFLQSKMDQIIHAGAQGHCLNNYTSVRNANLLSTHFLAAQALPRRVPLHFISSARVILQSGEPATPPISMAEYEPPTDGSQGFTTSKWASEVFLEKLVQAISPCLRVVVHRPCSIIGDRAPHDDAMNSVIRFSLLSHTVPSIPEAEGFFDFKNVVEVAKEIACGPLAKTDESSVEFRHYSSGVRVPFAQLAQRLETLHREKFEIVSMEAWLRTAAELGIEDLIVSYLRANVAGGGKLVFPYLGMEKE